MDVFNLLLCAAVYRRTGGKGGRKCLSVVSTITISSLCGSNKWLIKEVKTKAGLKPLKKGDTWKRKHTWCLVNNSERVLSGQGIVTVYILLDKQRDWHATGVYALIRNKKPPKINTTTFKTTYTELKNTHKDSVNKRHPLPLFPKTVRNQQQNENKIKTNRGLKTKTSGYLYPNVTYMYTNQDVCISQKYPGLYI